jgi:hypothetical protein
MLIQQTMIKRLRHVCQQDERLVAAMLYGSFTYSQGDQFSDIECLLFFEDDALEGIDQRAWAWGKEMASSLAARYGIAVPGPLIDKLDSLFLERHLADG